MSDILIGSYYSQGHTSPITDALNPELTYVHPSLTAGRLQERWIYTSCHSLITTLSLPPAQNNHALMVFIYSVSPPLTSEPLVGFPLC